MVKTISALCLALLLAGCEIEIGQPERTAFADAMKCPYRTVPPVDLPNAMRSRNWGGGSCMHAAWCDLLRWQGHEREAEQWRRTHSGGAGVADIAAIADRMNLDFALTDTGDADFLEWCSATRRGAAIYWSGGKHAITFLGYVDGRAMLIDNNGPEKMKAIPKDAFLRKWKRSGGKAITLVDHPAPPRPWI